MLSGCLSCNFSYLSDIRVRACFLIKKGNGGEEKSQIGAVLGALLGSNMKDGSISKISGTHSAVCPTEAKAG